MIQPKQKLSFTEKDKDWGIENVKFIQQSAKPVVYNMEDLNRLYRIAVGKLEEEEYSYVTNPLNTTNPVLKGYPARIRNYDIISPIILLFLGEKSIRPDNFTVVARNSDLPSIQKEVEKKLVLQNLQQMYVNAMNEQGVETGQDSQPEMPMEFIKKQVSSIPDQLSIDGQNALEYIHDNCTLSSKFRWGFYHWLVSGKVFTFKYVLNDEVEYKVIDPRRFKYVGAEIEYIEDARAAAYTTYMTVNEIVDSFKDLEGFKPEWIDELTNNQYTSPASADYIFDQTQILYDRVLGSPNKSFNFEGIPVTHVEWKSFRKVYKVTRQDLDGAKQVLTFDEDYIPVEGEDVTIQWITEVWEGYDIDGKFYFGIDRVPTPRNDESNISKCKLRYNGKVFGYNTSQFQSIVEKGEAFQKLYNIVHYNMEKVINKNKEKIMTMPLGLLPKHEGWDEFTAMYYADANGMLFVDETNKNFANAINGLKSIDLSLYNYISELKNILTSIRVEFYEAIGINNQRLGQIANSAGKSVTEAALQGSSLLSEELFLQFDEFEERELQGFLDLSKYAWIEGKKGMYRTSKGETAFLTVDPIPYINSNYGVFAKMRGPEAKNLEMAKQYAQAFAQNHVPPSTVLKIIQSKNMAKLIEEIEEMEKTMDQNQQAQAKAEQEAGQQTLQTETDNLNRELELRRYIADEANITAKEIAMQKIEADLIGIDADNNGVLDTIQLEAHAIKRDEIYRKHTIEREKLQIAKDKIAVEREKFKSAEKVAMFKSAAQLKASQNRRPQ